MRHTDAVQFTFVLLGNLVSRLDGTSSFVGLCPVHIGSLWGDSFYVRSLACNVWFVLFSNVWLNITMPVSRPAESCHTFSKSGISQVIKAEGG